MSHITTKRNTSNHTDHNAPKKPPSCQDVTTKADSMTGGWTSWLHDAGDSVGKYVPWYRYFAHDVYESAVQQETGCKFDVKSDHHDILEKSLHKDRDMFTPAKIVKNTSKLVMDHPVVASAYFLGGAIGSQVVLFSTGVGELMPGKWRGVIAVGSGTGAVMVGANAIYDSYLGWVLNTLTGHK
jgi:hypothetical protein